MAVPPRGREARPPPATGGPAANGPRKASARPPGPPLGIPIEGLYIRGAKPVAYGHTYTVLQ